MDERKKSVLVIDDDRFVREGLSELLNVKGFEADTAEDGFDALQKVTSRRYDVILLDLVMPGMDGVETLSRIMGQKPGANVLAMTAHSEYDMIASAIKAGAKSFFKKPIDSSVLENMIREMDFAAETRR